MINIGEKQLADYLDIRDTRLNGRLLANRVLRGVIRSIQYETVVGAMTVQVTRVGDVVPDLTQYACLIPGYEPAVGDTVDLIWRSRVEAVVYQVVQSLHAGVPNVTGVAGGLSGTPTVAGNDYGGIITFTTGGGNVAASTNLFTINFAAAFNFIPAIVVCFLDTLSYGGAAVGVNSGGKASFAVVNGDTLGLGTTFHISYIVRGIKQP